MSTIEETYSGYRATLSDGDEIRVGDFRLSETDSVIIVRGIQGEPLLSDEQAEALIELLQRQLADRKS